jgi:hypothetical protein
LARRLQKHLAAGFLPQIVGARRLLRERDRQGVALPHHLIVQVEGLPIHAHPDPDCMEHRAGHRWMGMKIGVNV